ncbi:MAG: TRAP transporter substrate-binding protein [Hyphomonadaceae bacterium]|nr:TRAP transporter substrate-binding protein [Hyphomonadaceae bacterium]
MSLSRRQTLAGLAAAGAAAGCSPAGSRPLFAADTHPADYPTVQAVSWMGEQLKQATQGRLSIRTYPGGQLGEEKDALEIAIFGGIDLIRVNLAPLNAIVPETVVPTLPFLFKDTAHMRRAMDGAPGDSILAALEPHGLIGLCLYDSGARSFYSTKGAIRRPADMRGQKIRVQNSDLFVAMVEALGGDATPMSFGEVYQALVQGVIDGAENNEPSFVSTRHFETARTLSMTRHVMAPEVLAMSAARWAKLVPADQAIVRATARASVPVMRGLWETRETEARAELAKAGVTVVEDVDQAAFASAVRPVWDRFLTDPAQRALADRILAMAEG